MLPENEVDTFYEHDFDILCWKIKHSKENEGIVIKEETDFQFAAMLTKTFMQFRIKLS